VKSWKHSRQRVEGTVRPGPRTPDPGSHHPSNGGGLVVYALLQTSLQTGGSTPFFKLRRWSSIILLLDRSIYTLVQHNTDQYVFEGTAADSVASNSPSLQGSDCRRIFFPSTPNFQMWSRCQYLIAAAIILLYSSNSAPVKKPPTRLKKSPDSIQKFDPFGGVKDSGKLLANAFSNNAVANVFKNTYSFFYWLPRRNIPFDTPWKLFGQFCCVFCTTIGWGKFCSELKWPCIDPSGNSSSEWIAWYQLPHNLPPYIYLSEGQEPADFFCWGLPGEKFTTFRALLQEDFVTTYVHSRSLFLSAMPLLCTCEGNTLPLGNWDPLFLQNTSPAVFRKYRESELKHGRLAMLSGDNEQHLDYE
jgi:Chlorophyll A-B binding protein